MSTFRDSVGSACDRARKRTRAGFPKLTDELLTYFQNMSREITHSVRSIVFKEGSPPDAIYVICAGQVKLFATAPDGQTRIVKIARLGDVLGLSAILNRLPYEVSAQTLSPCQLKSISQYPFLSYLESHAPAAYMIAMLQAKEYREMVLGSQRMTMAHSAAARISHILVDFATAGNPAKLASPFPMVLTHAELASLAATSRETVTRLLNQFEREEIISRNDTIITILKPMRLKQLAQ